jgi:hypothetical protein
MRWRNAKGLPTVARALWWTRARPTSQRATTLLIEPSPPESDWAVPPGGSLIGCLVFAPASARISPSRVGASIYPITSARATSFLHLRQFGLFCCQWQSALLQLSTVSGTAHRLQGVVIIQPRLLVRSHTPDPLRRPHALDICVSRFCDSRLTMCSPVKHGTRITDFLFWRPRDVETVGGGTSPGERVFSVDHQYSSGVKFHYLSLLGQSSASIPFFKLSLSSITMSHPVGPRRQGFCENLTRERPATTAF